MSKIIFVIMVMALFVGCEMGASVCEGDCTLNNANNSNNTNNTNNPEICNNGLDDDGDGYIDCNDSDCVNHSHCTGEQPEDSYANGCTNGVDDDGDGDIDCDDSDCADHSACQEEQPEDEYSNGCSNGVDDDGDGRIDCADSDCADHSACRNQPGSYMVVRPATNDYQSFGGFGSESVAGSWSGRTSITTYTAVVGNFYDHRVSGLDGFAYTGTYTGNASSINIADAANIRIDCYPQPGSFACNPRCFKLLGPDRGSTWSQVNFVCLINDEVDEVVDEFMSEGYANISSMSSGYIREIFGFSVYQH